MTNPFKKDTKPYLFFELAQPDDNGVSRWVSKSEFVGEYASLMFNNGGDWCRKESTLAKNFFVKFDKSQTKGTRIDAIKLDGFRKDNTTQAIRSDISKYYKQQSCVILGTSNPEIDHKNGWKNDEMVMNLESQKMEDFQPLSKAANDAKRQFCKECRRSGKRYDAKQLGYPMSYYTGGEEHSGESDGCIGCFWYDPIEFRKHLEFKG